MFEGKKQEQDHPDPGLTLFIPSQSPQPIHARLAHIGGVICK